MGKLMRQVTNQLIKEGKPLNINKNKCDSKKKHDFLKIVLDRVRTIRDKGKCFDLF